MDKDTRSQIQRATQNARSLLEREFAEQLEGTFDIRPDGTIAAVPGDHLDAEQRLIRQKLVAAINHHRAHAVSHAEAVDAYRREAAFTTLNRFVALKMLEARQLVQPCISQGEQSSGFKEFTGLAPGLVQIPDKGYRLYIECLFDEIAREVQVLFDRRDPASLLWPRRQSLTDLLDILNAGEIAGVWGQDETIGWVYQYFNSDDDRQKARYDDNGKPKAPQNSYELAVRNQFFTPRYVVEFLTDNTLGQIWYEMRQSKTRLIDECDYLVRRQSEVFLEQGEDAPAEDFDEDSSQEDLLQKTVYIPYRVKKDPRDLKILDPACGSGHFLLYTFDLLLTIYEEGWADEEAPVSEVTGQSLRQDYSTLEELKAAVPGLILRYNLHGIDIDPRAAQIASLALWMRAQRVYNDLGIARGQRQPIRKTNVVVAEPMPGDADQLEEFAASLDKQLGQLIRKIFQKMELAGEAGSLLKIEEEIRSAIREVYPEFGELYRAQDEQRWIEVEKMLLKALALYAGSSQDGNAYHRKLFFEDTSKGFAFIDICIKKYDVALMNPPFGDSSPTIRGYLEKVYKNTSSNLACSFQARASSLLNKTGMDGAIADTSIAIRTSYEEFRKQELLGDFKISIWAQLGWGVLDANVETHARTRVFSLDKNFCCCFDLSQSQPNKQVALLKRTSHEFLQYRWITTDTFYRLPNSIIDVTWPEFLSDLFKKFDCLKDSGLEFYAGNQLKADRYYRLFWEVATELENNRGDWMFASKGGPYSPYYMLDIFVAHVGKGFTKIVPDSSTVLRNLQKQGLPGVVYGKRGTFIDAQLLRAGNMFTHEGFGMVVDNEDDQWFALALLNSDLFSFGINKYCGQHKQNGYVNLFPSLTKDQRQNSRILALCKQIYSIREKWGRTNELDFLFSGPATQIFVNRGLSLQDRICQVILVFESDTKEYESIFSELEEEIQLAYGLTEEASKEIERFSLAKPKTFTREWFGFAQEVGLEYRFLWDEISYLIGIVFGHFFGIDEIQSLTQSSIEPLARWPIKRPSVSTNISEEVSVCDAGHPRDINHLIKDALANQELGYSYDELVDLVHLNFKQDISEWFQKCFFDLHVSVYKWGSRTAPIYWQLSTESFKYSIWLYYHHLTQDTFYKVLNDYVKPKLEHEERKLVSLSQEGSPNSTSSQGKEIAAKEAFVAELRAFRNEIAIIAPLWNPNLNDGVIINFAPLWRLVPHHRSWQKECKDCWDQLVKGDYDWAHLAMHLWPERVVPKCQTDRSLAIAHGLEEVFWEADDATGKWKPRQVLKEAIAQLIQERSSPAVKDALRSLLEAPAASGSTQTRSRRKKS